MYFRRLLLTLLALVCGNAQAQDSSSTQQVVRYWRVSDGRQMQTRLLGRTDSSITVVDPVNGKRVDLTAREARNVSLRLGQRNPLRGMGRGIAWGGGIGVGLGALIGVSIYNDNDGWLRGRDLALPVTAALGATGAGIGALFGLMGGGERWEAIPLARATGASVVLTGNRVGLRLPLGR